MTRLVRIVKLCKIAAEKRKERANRLEAEMLVEQGLLDQAEGMQVENEATVEVVRQSKVGAELSDIIIRRVIVIVLIMLCCVPLLTTSDPDYTEAVSTHLLHTLHAALNDTEVRKRAPCILARPSHASLTQLCIATSTFRSEMGTYTDGTTYLLSLTFTPTRSSIAFSNSELQSSLRSNEYSITKYTTYVDGELFQTEARFNQKPIMQELALLSVVLILFVAAMLLLGSIVFTKDVQRLVLDPIERMMNLVEAVAKDPLRERHDSTHEHGVYETILLENTLEKITALLRVRAERD
jgi:hypothetical protein